MTKDEALKLALDFLLSRRMGAEELIVEIQEALAQPAQEPDIYPEEARDIRLEALAYYTTPPAAQRKPLTDEKKAAIAIKAAHFDFLADYVEAITFVIERTEAAHGIKENT